jgi:hypothetical protein
MREDGSLTGRTQGGHEARRHPQSGQPAMTAEEPSCSWCQRSSDAVKHLVAGPGLAVCDECLSELSVILATEHRDWGKALMERLSKLG